MDTDSRDKINKMYRNLSNTIHGKYLTFETISENMFEFDQEIYKSSIKSIIYCENILLSLFRSRFDMAFQDLLNKLPPLERYSYGY